MTSSTSPVTSVFAGSRCVGFLFRRGPAGVETFDEQRSLGLFADQAEAVTAIAVAASTPNREDKCQLETSSGTVASGMARLGINLPVIEKVPPATTPKPARGVSHGPCR